MSSNLEFDLNISNYTENDLLELLGLNKSSSKEKIKENSNNLINKYREKNNFEFVEFFKNVEKLLINRLPDHLDYQNKNTEANKWLDEEYAKNNKARTNVSFFDQKDMSDIMKRDDLNVKEVYDLGIRQDSLNKILRQKITRTIIIDSKFRAFTLPFNNNPNNSTGSASDFSFSLSEPLNNVTSIKIVDLSIPNSIMIFDKYSANNFFFIETSDLKGFFSIYQIADSNDDNKIIHENLFNYSCSRIEIQEGSPENIIELAESINDKIQNSNFDPIKNIYCYASNVGFDTNQKIEFLNKGNQYVRITFWNEDIQGNYSIKVTRYQYDCKINSFIEKNNLSLINTNSSIRTNNDSNDSNELLSKFHIYNSNISDINCLPTPKNNQNVGYICGFRQILSDEFNVQERDEFTFNKRNLNAMSKLDVILGPNIFNFNNWFRASNGLINKFLEYLSGKESLQIQLEYPNQDFIFKASSYSYADESSNLKDIVKNINEHNIEFKCEKDNILPNFLENESSMIEFLIVFLYFIFDTYIQDLISDSDETDKFKLVINRNIWLREQSTNIFFPSLHGNKIKSTNPDINTYIDTFIDNFQSADFVEPETINEFDLPSNIPNKSIPTNFLKLINNNGDDNPFTLESIFELAITAGKVGVLDDPRTSDRYSTNMKILNSALKGIFSEKWESELWMAGEIQPLSTSTDFNIAYNIYSTQLNETWVESLSNLFEKIEADPSISNLDYKGLLNEQAGELDDITEGDLTAVSFFRMNGIWNNANKEQWLNRYFTTLRIMVVAANEKNFFNDSTSLKNLYENILNLAKKLISSTILSQEIKKKKNIKFDNSFNFNIFNPFWTQIINATENSKNLSENKLISYNIKSISELKKVQEYIYELLKELKFNNIIDLVKHLNINDKNLQNQIYFYLHGLIEWDGISEGISILNNALANINNSIENFEYMRSHKNFTSIINEYYTSAEINLTNFLLTYPDKIIKSSQTSVNLNSSDYIYIILDDFVSNKATTPSVGIAKPNTRLNVPSFNSKVNNKYSLEGRTGEIEDYLDDLQDPSLGIVCDQIPNDIGLGNELNIPSWPRNLTIKQLYSLNEIRINRRSNNSERTLNSPSFNDVIGIFFRSSQNRFEFKSSTVGGIIRKYFGPVELERFRVSLYDDRGNLVNLNGRDWSISIEVEQLYQY